jgi:hypothetical protein
MIPSLEQLACKISEIGLRECNLGQENLTDDLMEQYFENFLAQCCYLNICCYLGENVLQYRDTISRIERLPRIQTEKIFFIACVTKCLVLRLTRLCNKPQQ